MLFCLTRAALAWFGHSQLRAVQGRTFLAAAKFKFSSQLHDFFKDIVIRAARDDFSREFAEEPNAVFEEKNERRKLRPSKAQSTKLLMQWNNEGCIFISTVCICIKRTLMNSCGNSISQYFYEYICLTNHNTVFPHISKFSLKVVTFADLRSCAGCTCIFCAVGACSFLG